MRKNMVDVVMKLKFRIKIYSQVYNIVGSDHGGLTKFIIINQKVGFVETDINLVLLMLSII
jgi:hypothetical protein